ncbi:MAG: hypothetical protein AB2421_19100 [Thermotaleaceae bacterium]
MTTKKVILLSIIGFIVTGAVFGGVFYIATNRNAEEKVKIIKTFNYSLGELYGNVSDI